MGFHDKFFAWVPMDRNKSHIVSLSTKTGFLLFKEQVPFQFKNIISPVQGKGRPFG
jgi:hypothetical protein